MTRVQPDLSLFSSHLFSDSSAFLLSPPAVLFTFVGYLDFPFPKRLSALLQVWFAPRVILDRRKSRASRNCKLVASLKSPRVQLTDHQ